MASIIDDLDCCSKNFEHDRSEGCEKPAFVSCQFYDTFDHLVIIKTFLLACMTELILGFPLSLLHIFLFLYPARKHRHCLDYLWPFSLFYPLHWGSHPLSWFKRNISIVTFNLWLEVRAHQNALSVLPIACWTSLPHCPMGPSNLIHL